MKIESKFKKDDLVFFLEDAKVKIGVVTSLSYKEDIFHYVVKTGIWSNWTYEEKDLFGSAEDLANHVKKEAELSLVIKSIHIYSPTKLFKAVNNYLKKKQEQKKQPTSELTPIENEIVGKLDAVFPPNVNPNQTRLLNILKSMGVKHIEDLQNITLQELREMFGFGKKLETILMAELYKRNLMLKGKKKNNLI
jgi:DNA-directed RNA polymerase alpha subunit